MTSRASVERPTPGRVGPLEVLAFLSELAVFALLSAAGWNLAEPFWVRLALAVALPVAAIAVWGLWLAPRSAARAPQPLRLVAQLGILAACALLALAAELSPMGWMVPSAAAIVFGVAFLAERRSDGSA